MQLLFLRDLTYQSLPDVLLFSGDKCVVQQDGDTFYRSSVLSMEEDDTICVKLVDTGEDAIVTSEQIFKLQSDFQDYPQLAFVCSLSALAPVDTEDWTNESTEMFTDILLELSGNKDKCLPAFAKATIVNIEEGVVFVELSMDRTCIAQSLIELGVAKLVDLDDSNVDKQMDVKGLGIGLGVLEDFGAYKNVQLECDADYEVVMVDCDNLERLVLHTKTGEEKMEVIQDVIEEFVTGQDGGEGLPESLEEGWCCLAKCPVDEVWYRANLRALDVKTVEGDGDHEDKAEETKYQVWIKTF